MTMTKRRILWVATNPLMLAGVVWSGYFGGPKAVANLVVFFAWIFLAVGLVAYAALRILKWTLDSDATDLYAGDPVKRAKWERSRDEITAGIGTHRLSVPRWMDAAFDWVFIATVAGAGWFVTATVYLGGYLLQRGCLKIMDEVKQRHQQRMEEALGVKL